MRHSAILTRCACEPVQRNWATPITPSRRQCTHTQTGARGNSTSDRQLSYVRCVILGTSKMRKSNQLTVLLFLFLRPDPRRRSRRASGCRGNNVPPRTNVSHSTVADPEPPPPLSSSHANLGGFARLESRIWRACCPKLSPRTRRASDTFVSERQREGKGVYLPGYLRVGETGFVECRAFERVPI